MTYSWKTFATYNKPRFSSLQTSSRSATISAFQETYQSAMMSPAKIATSFAVLLTVLFPKASADPAKPCSPDKCKLPHCFCSGTKIPGNLSVSSIPQIVMITFDAAVNGDGFSLYEELFNGQFKNANVCNISATFFVSHEYTDHEYTDHNA